MAGRCRAQGLACRTHCCLQKASAPRAASSIRLSLAHRPSPPPPRAGTNAFLKDALAQKDVWAITNKQLLEWMADPVPASEMDQWLSCKPTNITTPVLPGSVKCQVHTVASGDTGGQLAAVYGATLAELAGANPGKQLESLSVGDKLNIPPWGEDCKAGAAAPEEKEA